MPKPVGKRFFGLPLMDGLGDWLRNGLGNGLGSRLRMRLRLVDRLRLRLVAVFIIIIPNDNLWLV